MGLLTSGPFDQDIHIASTLANSMCIMWNDDLFKTSASRPPMHVEVSRRQLEHACTVGAELFATGAFPADPGPYKRAAGFLVLGRHYPFFQVDLRSYGKPNEMTFEQQREEKEAWISRMLVAMLDPLIGSMTVRINGADRRLPNWRGFPSKHVHLDVLNWLRWLKNPHNMTFVASTREGALPIDWVQEANERQIRAIMALALIIENSHYCMMTPEERLEIVGQVTDCLSALSETAKTDLLTLTRRK